MKRHLLIVATGLFLLGAPSYARAAEPPLDVYRLMAYGQFEQAVERLENLLAEAPPDDAALLADANFLLGRAYEALGDWDAALRQYRVVTHEFTDADVFAEACLALAQLYGRGGQPKKAVTALEAALSRELSPEHDFRAQLTLAETISVPGTGVEDLDRALELFHALDEKARKPSDVARLSYGLAFCYQRRGDWERAEQYYIAAAETAPETLWALYSRMQRVAHYRRKQLNDEAARLAKQLRRTGMGVVGLARAEPRAPSLEELSGTPQAQDGEVPLPKNAVFSYNGYTITADSFSFNLRAGSLTGHGNASLNYATGTTRTHIRSAIVKIDLKLRHAVFTDAVFFETRLEGPENKARKMAGLKNLTIDLDTGRLSR